MDSNKNAFFAHQMQLSFCFSDKELQEQPSIATLVNEVGLKERKSIDKKRETVYFEFGN